MMKKCNLTTYSIFSMCIYYVQCVHISWCKDKKVEVNCWSGENQGPKQQAMGPSPSWCAVV